MCIDEIIIPQETFEMVGVTKKGVCRIKRPLGIHDRIKLYGVE